MNNKKASHILIYTRKPVKEYTHSLSNSIHLAYSESSDSFKPLNQNYGILFASATIDGNNVICEKGLKNPYLFITADGGFAIIAVRVDKEGKDDPESKGHILLWTSKDLINFNYSGLIKLHEELFVKEAVCELSPADNCYKIRWQDNNGNFYINSLPELSRLSSITSAQPADRYIKAAVDTALPDINPGNVIELDYDTAAKICCHWTPVYNTDIDLPDVINISSADELKAVRAVARYSDGSTTLKEVSWNIEGIDFTKAGVYTIKGKVKQKTYPFPLAKGYADPVILPRNNKYYYLATNDNVNDIGIFVREADTVMELFEPGFKESIILDVDEERNFIQTFWAPEFHVIGGELYILFAVGGRRWAPQCHMMKLKKGGNIMKAEDWETPVAVKRSDGSPLAPDGISLDMTYFKAEDTSCVVWSYRKGIGTALDTGSMIYIATIDENNPTILTSDPVLLTRPLYGWENIQGTINNEGPYALLTDDMVYITYSGGAAGGYTYALGLLSIPRGSNYLDINSWKKASTPVLSYYSIEGIYGPGHNSFFKDYDGEVMIMYHGEVKIAPSDTRCSAMHRVHFGKNNVPVFNMSGERDLNPDLAEQELKVNIIAKA